ncbi:AhpC/TSA family protein [Flavobacteriaceae bacterium F08102]|nr:AhpC/TSA family protein [Flavobacteriaceae bacterium F08102]
MKTVFALFLSVLLFCCNLNSTKVNDASFMIRGEVHGIPDQKVYLNLLASDSMNVQTFEPVLIKNGKFEFNGTILNPPALVEFTFEDENVKLWKRFAIDNSDMTAVINTSTLPNGGLIREGKIKGSPSNDAFVQFNTQLKSITEESRNFASIYRKLGNNGKLPKEKWSKEDLEQEAKMELLSKKAVENRNQFLDSLVQGDNELMKLLAIPVLAHWSIAPYDKVENCEAVFDRFDEGLKNSHIRAYYTEEIFRKSAFARIKRATTIGNQYRDFTQKNQHGESITVSDLIKPGKYLLLDFWASWCGPCRAENPNLLKAYKQYHEKGFEVLAISLDEKRDAWLKAIQKDQLPWEQVSDLNGFKNVAAIHYAINAIPSNFLIDDKGKIVAKNLRGEELHTKLKELFSAK